MNKQKTIIVTGGAGFIGSALIRFIIHETNFKVVNVDKLTYSGNLESLGSIDQNRRYSFEQIDICDSSKLRKVIFNNKPELIIHLAAESHVDRSIDNPENFLETNILGTFKILNASLKYFNKSDKKKKNLFRFLHISTDEVYGSLGLNGLFKESTAYDPSSPYSASKASSDHIVRAWFKTYGLPTIITNCSNNYGPYQFPEKLIPLIIINCLENKSLPIYGDGKNIRDWIYVDDHCKGIMKVLENGKIGETYNIGGNQEITNIDLVYKICKILDQSKPLRNGSVYSDLIKFVKDRPGHDFRYAIDSKKIDKQLNFKPCENIDTGLEKTVNWYLNNLDWINEIRFNKYNQERLGEL